MAKKQSFADKATKKAHSDFCPICKEAFQFVRHVKAVKTEAGDWKYQSRNLGVCKCNQKSVYA